jgi:hypothetical protein
MNHALTPCCHAGICMEKLMEVLIAIGDEAQCIAVSKRLLEKWPSHSRAMHVKNSIEGSGLGLNSFDKLEPKHPRLKLKRKVDLPNSPSKRIRQVIQYDLILSSQILQNIVHN